LESEIAPFADWVIWQALSSPKLEIAAVQNIATGDTTVIRFAVDNSGWLPTYVSKIGRDRKLCRGVVAEISVSNGIELLSGKWRDEGPQLEGRSHLPAAGFGWLLESTDHRHVFEWTVKGHGKVVLQAKHERAGSVSTTLDI
jgi:hypothetical protein